jgi:NADPH-dependent 7-cyano-7-deazaguanine reductase QueF
MTEDK